MPITYLITLLAWLALLGPFVQPAAGATTYKTYIAYKHAVGSHSLIASDPWNPRLLTDAEFAGQLSSGTALLGVYYGDQGWQMDRVRDMEGWQEKKVAVVNIYTNWCDVTATMDNFFDRQLIAVWENHNVPLISWEPFLCSPGQTPGDVEARAARGAYDAYFTRWAGRLKGFLSGTDGAYATRDDRRVYLRMGHEMNGDWVPWGAAVGRNSPADYIGMWRRVRRLLDSHGLDRQHVQWMWCVNHTDNGGFVAEQYYPGDDFVDWAAIDGYNWGETQSWSSWSDPVRVYGDMVDRLRALTTKPLAIPELASTSSTGTEPDVQAKSQWIADLFEYVVDRDVGMVVWFNEDKETDWAVFGGRQGDGAYIGDGSGLIVRRGRFWQGVGAAVLIAFVIAEAVFVARRWRHRKRQR